jgi:hypothetical protein
MLQKTGPGWSNAHTLIIHPILLTNRASQHLSGELSSQKSIPTCPRGYALRAQARSSFHLKFEIPKFVTLPIREFGKPQRFLLHRADEWAVSCQFRSADILRFLMLSLWACGQRACVVHHVHSDAALGRFAGMLFLITFCQGNKGAVGKAELLIERAACRSGS